MTGQLLNTHSANNLTSQKTLNAAAMFLFLVAITGQWIFCFYVATFYGCSAAQGNFAAWNKVLPHGYVTGDALGNIAIAVHLLLAVIILVCGPLQFIPKIRSQFPKFHRWNGKVYLVIAIACSLIGVYMGWTRGAIGGTWQHIGVGLNALPVVICGWFAYRYAVARNIKVHRRWALRFFFVVNGVWFFRVGLMFWIIVNQGPVGFDPQTFQGPFLIFLSFAQYLVPLAVIEIYLRAQDSANEMRKFSAAVLLFFLTLAMGVGIFGATLFMWLPRLA